MQADLVCNVIRFPDFCATWRLRPNLTIIASPCCCTCKGSEHDLRLPYIRDLCCYSACTGIKGREDLQRQGSQICREQTSHCAMSRAWICIISMRVQAIGRMCVVSSTLHLVCNRAQKTAVKTRSYTKHSHHHLSSIPARCFALSLSMCIPAGRHAQVLTSLSKVASGYMSRRLYDMTNSVQGKVHHAMQLVEHRGRHLTMDDSMRCDTTMMCAHYSM